MGRCSLAHPRRRAVARLARRSGAGTGVPRRGAHRGGDRSGRARPAHGSGGGQTPPARRGVLARRAGLRRSNAGLRITTETRSQEIFGKRSVPSAPLWFIYSSSVVRRRSSVVKGGTLSDLTERLAAICGAEYVSDKLVDRICHTRDCGPTPGGIPAVIARPRTTEQVSAIVRVANDLADPHLHLGALLHVHRPRHPRRAAS